MTPESVSAAPTFLAWLADAAGRPGASVAPGDLLVGEVCRDSLALYLVALEVLELAPTLDLFERHDLAHLNVADLATLLTDERGRA